MGPVGLAVAPTGWFFGTWKQLPHSLWMPKARWQQLMGVGGTAQQWGLGVLEG